MSTQLFLADLFLFQLHWLIVAYMFLSLYCFDDKPIDAPLIRSCKKITTFEFTFLTSRYGPTDNKVLHRSSPVDYCVQFLLSVVPRIDQSQRLEWPGTGIMAILAANIALGIPDLRKKHYGSSHLPPQSPGLQSSMVFDKILVLVQQ